MFTLFALFIPKPLLLATVFSNSVAGVVQLTLLYDNASKETRNIKLPDARANSVAEGGVIRSAKDGISTIAMFGSNKSTFYQVRETTNEIIRKVIVDDVCLSLIPANDPNNIWWIGHLNQIEKTNWKTGITMQYLSKVDSPEINQPQVTRNGDSFEIRYFEGNGMATTWLNLCTLSIKNPLKPKIERAIYYQFDVADAGYIGGKLLVLQGNGAEWVDGDGNLEKCIRSYGINTSILG
jgi:hypothetical protein